ncbi:MAG: HEAT repeat domain-containing protein [Gemmatimonadales bacterium]
MNGDDLAPTREPVALLQALNSIRRDGRRDRRAEVLELIGHPSPLVREEALSLLLSGWKEADVRADALAALRHDPDFGVRTTAAIGLAGVSSEATAQQDTEVLAAVVRDTNEDVDVRRAAYEALCLIHRRPVPPLNRAFDVDRDVDVEWLGGLGRGRKGMG